MIKYSTQDSVINDLRDRPCRSQFFKISTNTFNSGRSPTYEQSFRKHYSFVFGETFSPRSITEINYRAFIRAKKCRFQAAEKCVLLVNDNEP